MLFRSQEGDTLTEAGEELSITMNEEILQVPGVETANILYLQDADGNYYGDGCTMIDGSTASLAVSFGEPGDYRFSYTVVSADTHPVSGEIHFTWSPEGDHEPSPALAELPVCGEEPVLAETNGETAEATAIELTPEESQAAADESATTDDAVTGGAETPVEEDNGAVPGWVYIVISVAAAALIIGLIVGNALRVRRMRSGYGEPTDDN